MKHRNPFAVILFTIITLGIYGLVWTVKTKLEMNRLGAKIPTAWLIIIPLVNIWWLWKYSEGVEQVTGNKVSTILSFILLFVLGVIGSGIIQYEFNKVDSTAAAVQPEVPETPAPTAETPATPEVAAPAVPPAPVAETAPVVPEAAPAPVVSESTPVAATPTTEQQPAAPAPEMAQAPAEPSSEPSSTQQV